MDIYDAKAVRAVWARVRPESVGDRHTPQEDGVALLRSAIEAERASICAYCSLRTLLPRLGGVLDTILCDERRHLRELTALVYLLTGTREEPQTSRFERGKSTCAALREAYCGELKAAKGYDAMAEALPEQAQMLRAAAADERRHACMLHRLMTKLMQ
mgnify:FL=1